MTPLTTKEMAMLPVNADGRLYHLGLKKGELAPRILTVGDYGRAERIANACFSKIIFSHTSDRGFSTWTGYYNNILVSVVSIGMGLSMMDFMVREARTIVEGPMAIIRFGTCGSLDPTDEVGTLCVSSSSCLIFRNPDYFISKKASSGYFISEFELPDPILSKLLLEQLESEQKIKTITGANASADSFYSSQGRIVNDHNGLSFFKDDNETLTTMITKTSPPVRTLEMETFQLFHLANSAQTEMIYSAAVMMIVANRPKNLFAFCDERRAHLEKVCGKACFDALTNLNFYQ